ncbi:hypothetical protein [Akkermansia sp.]|uniref:hypothetical protein n=1 Tax=Akkermansia sp. TaxID=1872421 RepID=UPI00258FF1D3|nr:hypothetical protein [Akkermansia sp.]
MIAEGVMTKNINSPSIPYKDESIINNWENVKKQWKEIKNNDYYKSSDLKKLFERYDCNMNLIFKEIPVFSSSHFDSSLPGKC